MWALIFAVIAALASMTAIMRWADGETIQLEREHGIYMVPVRVNGAIILPFILDSGAAEVSIPADVFLTLTRTNTVTMNDYVGTGTYVLADGSEQPSERFILHELRVGDHVIRNVVANVAPVRGDPLLGQTFLSQLRGWTIDNEHHMLVLGDSSYSVAELPASRRLRSELLRVWHGEYVCAQGLTSVDVSIDEITAGYDLTGSFRFYNEPGMHNAKSGSYAITGIFDPTSNTVAMTPTRWIQQPAGYSMVGFTASPNRDWTELDGRVDFPGCLTISLH